VILFALGVAAYLGDWLRRSIVTSYLPNWTDTRLWVLARGCTACTPADWCSDELI
jgi:hypothetical protein